MKKRLLIIGLFLLGAFFLILITVLPIKTPIQTPNDQITPTLVPVGRPNHENEPINDLQKVVIGQTTDEEISKIPGIKLVSEDGGQKLYELPSVINARPHQITTIDGLAKTERVVLPAYTTQRGYMTINDMVKKYGIPEKMLQGTEFYGYHTQRHLYPTKGLYFVVNPNTNEVFEVFQHPSMNLDAFLDNYPEETKALQRPIEHF